MLSYLSTVADLLAVGMQGYEFIDKLVKDPRGSDSLKLLYIMQTPTLSWKKIHVAYSGLIPSMRKIYNATHNKNGSAKRNIVPSSLQTVFQDTVLYKSVFDLEPSLKVSMENISLSFSGTDIKKKIDSVTDDKIRMALANINSTKSQAEKVHKDVCEFFGHISTFIDKPVWDDNDVSYILNARKIYKMEAESMLDYTDQIIIGLLEIYEVAFMVMKS